MTRTQQALKKNHLKILERSIVFRFRTTKRLKHKTNATPLLDSSFFPKNMRLRRLKAFAMDFLTFFTHFKLKCRF